MEIELPTAQVMGQTKSTLHAMSTSKQTAFAETVREQSRGGLEQLVRCFDEYGCALVQGDLSPSVFRDLDKWGFPGKCKVNDKGRLGPWCPRAPFSVLFQAFFSTLVDTPGLG